MSARHGATGIAAGGDRCPREAELLAGLGRGFLGLDVEAHLQECAACRELHLVAGALLDERAAAVAEARVPSAGTVWWRLRLRHRQEAQASARRTLFVGQAVSLAVAVGLLLALFGPALLQVARQLVASIQLSTPLLLALATLLVLAPIGGWFALRAK
jgi:predicted anti-sigma-YlaC factor YlaD